MSAICLCCRSARRRIRSERWQDWRYGFRNISANCRTCRVLLAVPCSTRSLGCIMRTAMPARTFSLDDAQFALISKALADPKRVELLQKLGESTEPPTCTDLRDCLGLAAATISHHLKELETAGLVRVERHGKFAHVSIRRDVLKAYAKRLSEF